MTLARPFLLQRSSLRAAAWAVLLSFGFSAAAPCAGAAEPDPQAAAAKADAEAGAAEDTLTMSFDGASLKDVLLLFSQKTGMNFVASQDVESRKITVYFENVSPKEALDAIMTTNNLTYTRKQGSSIYMVYAQRNEKPDLITKVFRLKYARLSSSPLDIGGQETVKDLKTMASASTSSTSSSSSSSSSSSTASAPRGIDLVIRPFLSPQGKMATDISTNSIIITDTADTIAQIQKMMVELDVPQQQVILECHVMEIQKGLISDKGVEWGGDNGELMRYGGGAVTTQFPLDEKSLQKLFRGTHEVSTVDASTAADVLNEQTAIGPQMQFGVINANSFSAILHYIVTDSKTKILARPRILTQNNEAAVIRLVTNAAIADQTETTTTQGTATSTAHEAERTETGVTLRMTPQVNADNSVSLFVEPSVTTVGTSLFIPGTFFDPTTRVVRTMARVLNNQTLVIGGLIDSTVSLNKKKIPYLGDIPGIGRLFSYDADSEQDRELVVFITPHIVEGDNSLTQSGVTSVGRDVTAMRALEEFRDLEADIHMSAFEGDNRNIDTVNNAKVRRERNAAIQAGQKASDPAVDKQMAMALDAFSPQLLDDEISKALSFQSPAGHSKSG